jgi:hypothetical protein
MRFQYSKRLIPQFVPCAMPSFSWRPHAGQLAGLQAELLRFRTGWCLFVRLLTVPPSGNGVQRRPRRSIRLDGSVALAPWLGFPPERSSRSAFNRRTSAVRRRGSGVEMTSAKAVRNPPASVNGNFIRSSGTLAERRTRPVLRQKNFPARSCVYLVKCASGGFVRTDPRNERAGEDHRKGTMPQRRDPAWAGT